MDILIDLIVFLIKQATKPKAPQPPRLPPTPQEVQRQQSTLAQQVEAMQRTIAARQTQKRPDAGRMGRVAQPPSLPRTTKSFAPSPTKSPPPEPVLQRVIVPLPPRKVVTSNRLPELRRLLMLGEMLSAPVALRDLEV